jgi:hypothetical protein
MFNLYSYRHEYFLACKFLEHSFAYFHARCSMPPFTVLMDLHRSLLRFIWFLVRLLFYCKKQRRFLLLSLGRLVWLVANRRPAFHRYRPVVCLYTLHSPCEGTISLGSIKKKYCTLYAVKYYSKYEQQVGRGDSLSRSTSHCCRETY